MKAEQKVQINERHFYQPKTVDFTSTDRYSRSAAVYSTPSLPLQKAVELEREHCAVLGYN